MDNAVIPTCEQHLTRSNGLRTHSWEHIVLYGNIVCLYSNLQYDHTLQRKKLSR